MGLGNRVIYSDNGTLTDYSTELKTFTSQTVALTITTGEDYLYVGSDLPFNNKFFDVSVANSTAAAVTIEYWDGTEWVEAVDIQDSTDDAGTSLAASGHIQWGLDRDLTGWAEEHTEDITELASLKIYNLYWMRMSWSDTVAATVNYIGQKFAEDENITIFYPDLTASATLTAFTSGKTDWNDQHFLAAQDIVRDLKQRRIIIDKNQILNWRLFTEAGVHKVAEIIYNAFGESYTDNRRAAAGYYKNALDNVIYDIDSNRNATLDQKEKRTTTGFMTR